MNKNILIALGLGLVGVFAFAQSRKNPGTSPATVPDVPNNGTGNNLQPSSPTNPITPTTPTYPTPTTPGNSNSGSGSGGTDWMGIINDIGGAIKDVTGGGTATTPKSPQSGNLNSQYIQYLSQYRNAKEGYERAVSRNMDAAYIQHLYNDMARFKSYLQGIGAAFDYNGNVTHINGVPLNQLFV